MADLTSVLTSMCVVSAVVMTHAILTLLFLTFKNRLLTSNCLKVTCVYLVVTLFFNLPTLVIGAGNTSWITTIHGCRFYSFCYQFYHTCKGIFVVAIALMPIIDRKIQANENIHRVLAILPMVISVLVVTAIPLVFAVLSVVSAFMDDFSQGHGPVCRYGYHHIAHIVYVIVLGLMPCVTSVAITIVSLVTSRGVDVPCKVTSLVIVVCHTLLWMPWVCSDAALTFGQMYGVNVEFWAITGIIANLELAIAPVLLLILPTEYKRALKEMCMGLCKSQMGEVCTEAGEDGQEMVGKDGRGVVDVRVEARQG